MLESVDSTTRKRKVVIVGAGPVGCLAAMAFARRGWSVQVLEARDDIRLTSSLSSRSSQRSINLAISHRGIAAIQAIDDKALQQFIHHAIPMKGRMVHQPNGTSDSQNYDRNGQCINSIDRNLLNSFLLDRATEFENINVLFHRKVQYINFDKGSIDVAVVSTSTSPTTSTTMNVTEKYNFDFCIGADGSHSIVRRQMMKFIDMDYQQEYIPSQYIEARIPPGIDATTGNPTFLLDPNHLHIWPRHSFMLIALPNKDKSFTCTLFAPRAELAPLTHESAVLSWFDNYFPDVINLVGPQALVSDILNNPRSSLICTKSYPYHYKDKAILLGDAAHSMVPFYGQGLNCGLEDVRILDALIGERGVRSTYEMGQQRQPQEDLTLSQALSFYSENRHQDLIAICDLAMENYVEMRDKVLSPVYQFKRSIDNILQGLTNPSSNSNNTNHHNHNPGMSSLAAMNPILSKTPFPGQPPRAWLPLYTMVTFRPDISYATARRKAQRQDRILKIGGLMNLVAIALLLAFGGSAKGWRRLLAMMRIERWNNT